MIYSVRGNLILMDAGIAVVECGGVGYRVQTSINTQKKLKLNSEVMLYTYMNVREDAMELFGFADKNELSTFKLLIGITGVGPKLAQRIVLELKDKMQSFAPAEGFDPGKGSVIADTGKVSKAVSALAVLGFSAADVTPILSRLDPELTVEQMISATLKQLA